MTQKEAIETLLLGIKITFDEVEEHEEFAADEQGEFQIKSYEDNKKELEAYTVILGADAAELPEPSEAEKELFEILNPWHKKREEETGYSEDFELGDEENKTLARINMEKGRKRVMIDEDPDEAEDPSEDDTFAFYPYRGRIQVVYNYEGDGDFCSYPIEFQEKAFEFIKKALENLE